MHINTHTRSCTNTHTNNEYAISNMCKACTCSKHIGCNGTC